MSDLPSLPLFVDAYLADANHLSDAEHGRYLLLLMHMWIAPDCRLPNDDEWLGRRFRRSPEQVRAELRPIIEEFCKSSKKWITQKRLKAEWDWCQEKRGKSTKAAKSRWGKEKDESERTSDRISERNAGAECERNAPNPIPIKKDAANAAPPTAVNGLFGEPDPDAELFRRGRELFGKESGGLMVKLKRAKNGSIPEARKALEAAARKDKPREYIGKIIAGREVDEDWPSGIPGVI